MKLRTFIATLCLAFAARFLPAASGHPVRIATATPRPKERFSIEVTKLSPEVLSVRYFAESQTDGMAEMVLANRICVFRAYLRDEWSNPVQHIAIESPLFNPTSEEKARRILDEACDYVMKVRTGEWPPMDSSAVKPSGILT